MHQLDLQTGIFDGSEAQSRRTLADLASLFRDQSALAGMDLGQIVYETFGCPGEVEGPPRLLYATTVLQPGQVGGEYFMTRGHFHLDPTRGENMIVLKGQGALILMNRLGDAWHEEMKPGSVHDIDGRYAHRVVNTGNEPLVFYVIWMSDCGHDYRQIERDGFGKTFIQTPEGPALVE